MTDTFGPKPVLKPYPWPADMGPETRRNVLEIIDAIASAADRGERCPTTTDLVRRGLSNPPIARLADLGFLRTEVYAKNWRMVWICGGPHLGKSTKAAPYSAPYKVIGPERPVAA